MDDMTFIIRKQRVSELISQNKWSEACFLLRKNLQEVNLQQIEQNSWILLTWLKCCIQIQDYEQASEVIQLSQNRVISFNLKQNINWLELHQELILSSGIKNNKQALAKSSETSGGQTAPGLSFPNNAPGLYIAPNTNDLVIVMNTFEDPNQMIVVQDIH